MNRILLNIIAFILVGISFIFNSYLLALCLNIIYSSAYLLTHYNVLLHSFKFFTVLGFSCTLLLLVIGFSEVPILSKIMTHSRQPLTKEQEKINAFLRELLEIIKDKTIKLPRVFIGNGLEPNASSYGKNTLIIEKVLLLNYNDDEIKAVLLHEMSHLINKDSLITLAIFWINIPLQIIIWAYPKLSQYCLKLLQNFNKSLLNLVMLIPLIILFPLVVVGFIGKVLLNITFMFIRRMFEYASDKFVVNCGYRDALISFLEKQLLLEKNTTMIDRIIADHPSIAARIAKLETD